MRAKLGLQAKMTASYVAVTAGAALLAEILIFVLVSLHPTTTLSAQELADRAQATATGLAAKVVVQIGKAGRIPAGALGKGVPTPGKAQLDSAGGIAIPETTTELCDPEPATFAVAVSPSGTVLATSYPACFPVGSPAGSAPGADALTKIIETNPQGSGIRALPHGRVIWASAPLLVTGAAVPKPASTAHAAASAPASPGQRYGIIYVEAPPVASVSGGFPALASLIPAGVAAGVLSVPVGVAFGLISTWRLTRRLQRLASLTAAVAEGEFELRVPVYGADELSVVEQSFNRMAARLSASLDAERRLAAANARHHERSRIARELHDSISQDLFSLGVLSGGLRRALPPGSPMRPAVETMERTAGETMREMQALLLALRPVALGEAGLPAALDGICRAHRERLGIDVRAELDDVVLPAPVEHAILRVAQEALGNAVKHASPDVIRVRLNASDSEVTLEVADDGGGFDPAGQGDGGAGLGLRAMRDRVQEIGGELRVESTPGTGTVVRAAFPRGSS
jgi:signal transduction histidine kinase